MTEKISFFTHKMIKLPRIYIRRAKKQIRVRMRKLEAERSFI